MLKTDDIFSDGLILQQQTDNPVMGCANAGEKVGVALKKCGETIFSGEAVCTDDGRWRVEIPPQEAGKTPYELLVTSGSEAILIGNVLFGDVFHIAGQSNMELPMYRTYDPFSDELERPDNPYIREFRVPVMPCFDKDTEEKVFEGGSWVSSNEDYTLDMSAAGYYFAKTLFEKLDIPIGLVNTSVGGAPIEGMLPYRITKDHPQCRDFLKTATEPGYLESITAESEKNDNDWLDEVSQRDKIGELILKGEEPENKRTVVIPTDINDIEGFDGFSGRLWFWKTFTIDDDTDIDNAMLILGTLTDADAAYINGVYVGTTDYMYPPRYYRIGHGVLKRGENRVALWLNVKNANGGFTVGKRYCVKCADKVIDLAGEWSFAEAVRMPKQKPVTYLPGLPLCIYGRTFAPAFSHKYKGMVMYQGESNAGHPETYRELFTTFVDFYRQKLGWEIPIITTQLCNFSFVEDDGWCALRQAQLECTELDSTAMAVTIDIGEYNDLHPINKAEVGRRLALCAEKLIYEKTDAKPARCVKAEQSGRDIALTFSEEVRLEAEDAKYFEVSFDGESFVRASAKRSDEKIIVSAPEDGTVQAVRYLWVNSPDAPELFTSDGLPVSPFRFVI